MSETAAQETTDTPPESSVKALHRACLGDRELFKESRFLLLSLLVALLFVATPQSRAQTPRKILEGATHTQQCGSKETLRSLCEVRHRAHEIREGSDHYFGVDLTGVITYVDKEWHVVFLTDGGCSLATSFRWDLGGTESLEVGAQIQVQGCLTNWVSVHPTLVCPPCTLHPQTELPDPIPIAASQLGGVEVDAQWITTTLEIQEVSIFAGRLIGAADIGDRTLRVVALGNVSQDLAESLLEGPVRVTGNASGWKFAVDGSLLIPALSIPTLGHLQPLGSSQPENTSGTSSQRARHFHATGEEANLSGSFLTFEAANRSYVMLADGRVSTLITELTDLYWPSDILRIHGTWVDRERLEVAPRIVHARTPPSSTPIPRATRGKVTDFLKDPASAAQWIQTVATLKKVTYDGEGFTLSLESDGAPFEAWIRSAPVYSPALKDFGAPPSMDQLKSARTLQLTGVLVLPDREDGLPRLVVHSERFFSILETRRFWMTSSALQITLALVFASSLIVAVAWHLRQRLRKTENQLSRTIRQLSSVQMELTAATEELPSGIVFADASRRVIHANRKFAEQFELSEAEMSTATVLELLLEGRTREPEALPEILEDAHGEPSLRYVETLQGEHLQVRKIPVQENNNVHGFLWVFEPAGGDQASNQHSRTQRLLSVAELSCGMVHDLNNVLMVIQSNLSRLETQESSDPTTSREALIRNADDAVQRGAELARRLLQLSQGKSPTTQICNVAPLAEDLVETLGPLLGRRIKTEIIVDEDLWPIRIERGGFEQVVLNLVINARDALPKAGTIQIILRNAPEPSALGGDAIRLMVRDNGMGMDTETKNRIFETFYTTKSTGTGLGLAFVRQLVALRQGAIHVDSELGIGTTFTLHFPAARTSAEKT